MQSNVEGSSNGRQTTQEMPTWQPQMAQGELGQASWVCRWACGENAPDEGCPPADEDGQPRADGTRWQAGQAHAGHLPQRTTSRDTGILTKGQASWFLLQQGRWKIL